MNHLTSRLITWAVVVVTWLALWGAVDVGTFVGGALVATGVVLAMGAGPPRQGTLRPGPALHFLVAMGWNLVKATTLVAWEVVTPRNRIVEGIIAVPLPEATPVVLTVVTGAIGLTPGTVVVEIDEDPCVAYVHVLHLHDIEQVRAELAQLHQLAMRAFGPPDTVVTPTHATEGPAGGSS